MGLTMDLHTHTTMSHGKGSIEDNVEVARRRGLRTIAITDHGLGHVIFGMRKKHLAPAREAIDRLNQKYQGDIHVLLGVEANLIGLDGAVDIPDEIAPAFDIVLVGYHRGAMPKTFRDFRKVWTRSFGITQPRNAAKLEDFRAQVTESYIRAMDQYKIDVITHPGHLVPVDLHLLARAAAKRNVALEINCKHHLLDVRGVQKILDTDVKIAIDSDAHHPDAVGVLDWGLNVAREAGLDMSRVLGWQGDETSK